MVTDKRLPLFQMAHMSYYGKIENGNGAQRNARTITSPNILFLFRDNGDISSNGLMS